MTSEAAPQARNHESALTSLVHIALRPASGRAVVLTEKV